MRDHLYFFLDARLSSAMAGNIIPAIATTNAVIAGLIVLEALKILSGDLEQCRTVSGDPAKQNGPRTQAAPSGCNRCALSLLLHMDTHSIPLSITLFL